MSVLPACHFFIAKTHAEKRSQPLPIIPCRFRRPQIGPEHLVKFHQRASREEAHGLVVFFSYRRKLSQCLWSTPYIKLYIFYRILGSSSSFHFLVVEASRILNNSLVRIFEDSSTTTKKFKNSSD